MPIEEMPLQIEQDFEEFFDPESSNVFIASSQMYSNIIFQHWKSIRVVFDKEAEMTDIH